jgi:hypothetical protein
MTTIELLTRQPPGNYSPAAVRTVAYRCELEVMPITN